MSESDKNNPSQDEHLDSEEEVPVEATPGSESGEPLAELTKKFQAVQQELLYQRAEFENSRKRMQREQEKAILFSNERLINELLTVEDQFDRALTHSEKLNAKEDPALSPFLDGIRMTHQELLKMLARFGVEFVGKVGEPFNPAHHEAIAEQEAPEKKANTILAVHQKGCLLHGRLLKPAKVVVAKPGEND